MQIVLIIIFALSLAGGFLPTNMFTEGGAKYLLLFVPFTWYHFLIWGGAYAWLRAIFIKVDIDCKLFYYRDEAMRDAQRMNYNSGLSNKV
jgi:hypothetical protein